jgi:PAS domain S-box-containing protein
VITALGASRAAILLFDPDEVLRFKAWRGLSQKYRGATEGHSPWSQGTAEAEPLLVSDARADKSLAALQSAILAERIGALAFFPLLQPGRLLGKFMAYYDTPHRFTQAESMLGQLIAGHVAFAVERMRSGEAQSRLGAIVESSNDAIISKNLQGTIQTWNPGAERLFGYTAVEAIGRPITMLIPADRLPEEAEILDRIRRGQRIEHYETIRVAKTGRQIDISLAISPVRDTLGRIIGASKIARDITDQKQTQKEHQELLAREQAARAEAEAANRAKDDFLATLSHELRTPLNSILGWAQVLGSAHRDPGLVDRALDAITRNARQQARLVDDLLDLSSIIGGRLRLQVRTVDLVTVVGAALESIRPAAVEKALDLRTAYDSQLGPLQGDPERLQQIFWNVLTNAVKFSPRGGRIDVRVTRKQSRAVVQVSDCGIGIRPEVLPVIFERFRQGESSVTRAHGGLGLGLAIVRQLVEMHGGTVEAASPGEGQGATLTVALPLVTAKALPDLNRSIASVDLTLCEGIHTLLVDDEADGREVLTVYLQQCGAQVTAVGSGAEALDVLAGQRPDIVVSDIAMPVMDGYELIRRVRRLPGGRTLPAIALTAHANADARVAALRAGYDIYLTKPVDAAELSAVVSRLGRRPPGS